MTSKFAQWLSTVLLLIATVTCAVGGLASPCTDSGINYGQRLTAGRHKVKIAANHHFARALAQQQRNLQPFSGEGGPSRIQSGVSHPIFVTLSTSESSLAVERFPVSIIKRWLLFCSLLI